MAFTLQALRGTVSYNLSDSAPFSMEQGDDLGGASVRNIEEQGPYQDGSSHLAERLDPRTITLRLNVQATSDSLLDGYRDTLNTIFKPVRGVPITLKVTRDDGAVRQIDCRRTGPLAIPLVPMNRPGHLHRAVVQLRAADPVWYNPTQGTAALTPPAGDWWRAFNTVGTANVLEHVEAPTQGQAWANTVGVAAGSAWSLVVRSGTVSGTTEIYAFHINIAASESLLWENSSGNALAFHSASGGITADLFSSGTQNVLMVQNGGTAVVYRNNVAMGTIVGQSRPVPTAAAGTARWRSDYVNTAASRWPVALPYAAVYNIALDVSQRGALETAINLTAAGGSAFTVAVPYLGNVDSYPVIAITGPVTSPIITNTTTGDVLDFTGGTVGSTDVWTIDTRYGRKSVLNIAGASVANYLSAASDLATFRLVPDPLAAGGTNVITVAGTVGGTAAVVSIAYYNRYLSF